MPAVVAAFKSPCATDAFAAAWDSFALELTVTSPIRASCYYARTTSTCIKWAYKALVLDFPVQVRPAPSSASCTARACASGDAR